MSQLFSFCGLHRKMYLYRACWGPHLQAVFFHLNISSSLSTSDIELSMPEF